MTNKLNKVLFGTCLTLACSCASWSSSGEWISEVMGVGTFTPNRDVAIDKKTLLLNPEDLNRLHEQLTRKEDISSICEGKEKIGFRLTAEQTKKFHLVYNSIVKGTASQLKRVDICGIGFDKYFRNHISEIEIGAFIYKLGLAELPANITIMIGFHFNEQNMEEISRLENIAAITIAKNVSKFPTDAKLCILNGFAVLDGVVK